MAIAIYTPYTDDYGHAKPDIHEAGLQYVSEADTVEDAFRDFDHEIGVGELSADDFAFVEGLPAGASEWSNERVNAAAKVAEVSA